MNETVVALFARLPSQSPAYPQPPPLMKLLPTFVVAGFVATSVVSLVQGATPIASTTNPTVVAFGALPAATEFSTMAWAISGASAYTTGADIDTAIGGLAASSVTTALVNAGSTTAANDLGQYGSGMIYTRPDGNGSNSNNGAGLSLIMGTFSNNTGGTVSSLGIEFDYARTATGAATESVGGLRLYYSLTGLAGSWNLISALGDTTATIANPAHPSATVNFSTNWAAGSNLYLLWVDDNANGQDHGYAIDNLSLSAVAGSPVPEPSVALLGALGSLALLRRRRK